MDTITGTLTEAIRAGSVSMGGDICIGITRGVDSGKSVAEAGSEA